MTSHLPIERLATHLRTECGARPRSVARKPAMRPALPIKARLPAVPARFPARQHHPL